MNLKFGKLILLVGPSGAGKSTYAEELKVLNGNWPDMVVSTDCIRHQLCGDFRDQSKNYHVFDYVHKLIRLRNEHGLDTIVDATNLKTKDRNTIRSLVMHNTKIEYHVIDRPLEDKLRDGGWRLEVDINGKNLVEVHHQTFQSNLKEILEGDSDSRVTVFDMRIK